MGETNVLFSIGPLEVTGAVVTMWVIVAVLALVSWLATRKLRDVPGPLQNAAEMAVEKLQGFYGGIMGPANARRYFPMMATFFIFIVVSNYIGLLPGAGQVFTVPTATLSVTAGLAIIAFCMTHTVGIQRRGLGGYLKSFIKPFLLMLPLNLIEQIVRPFSLALRLYGNLYGEEMVTHELGNLFPLVLPLLMQVPAVLPDPGHRVHDAAVDLYRGSHRGVTHPCIRNRKKQPFRHPRKIRRNELCQPESLRSPPRSPSPSAPSAPPSVRV